MLDQLLCKKQYPDILTMLDGSKVTPDNWDARRAELLALLEKYSYGKTPSPPSRVWADVTFSDHVSYAGKVFNEKVDISFETEKGTFTFPIELFVPHTASKPPVFLHIAFGHVPHRYIPVEEITDAGFALAVMVYTDVVNDNHFGDYSDGLAKYFGTSLPRADDEWGKIGMWAYAASRVMDYLTDIRNDVDSNRVALIGHSRLGKTALWCGAQDTRFAAVIANNSGYGGASSSKGGAGERVTDFLKVGSWDWFCENFKKFQGEYEDKKPYDQSFLTALIAPRLLCIGSAVLDKGADPPSEFLTTLWASRAWELLGVSGLVCPDRMPTIGDDFSEGNVGYHLRDNCHYLSREDWHSYINFLKEWII